MVTGNILSQNSSTKSCCICVWINLPLPCTCNSGPFCCLSFCISSAMLPFKKTDFFHSCFVSVLEATYFVALLMPGPSSSCCGQYDANISNVFLPNNRSNGLPICSVIILPRNSSKYGTVHPPYLKPPLSSSPGPPGACITPSRVIKVRTIIFLIKYSFLKCQPGEACLTLSNTQ